jgi:RNA polymerase sigma factor (sigma-70 family)
MTDGQLLECFLSRRDGAAFAALVRRHGPMVWGVCRRVLPNHHDAEDAFQATFLVLVRKAASVQPREMVANWLYGVAHQTALKARATGARRKARERQVANMPEPAVEHQGLRRDLHALLDQELSALPDKYRVAIVLCDLGGRSRKEVARQLGVPEGTLSGRLTRGRALLAKRIARHGPVLSGGALAALLSHSAASAGGPASVVASTIKAASLYAAGQAAGPGLISAKVAALTDEVLKAMLLTKLKVLAAVAVLVIAGSLGAGAFTHTALIAGQPGEPTAREEGSAMPQEPRSSQRAAHAEPQEPKRTPPPALADAKNPGNAPAAQSAAVCRVIQKVYHNGWKICSEIVIYADASYSWTVHDLWGEKRIPKVFRGTLPKRVFDEVSASCKESSQFKKVKDIPSYEYGIDDYRTKHPEGIEPLIRFLMERHETPPEKLRQLADDTTADRKKRVEAVFSLFANHLRPPKDAAAVHEILGEANWLKDAKLYAIHALGGQIPLEWRQGDSVFVLHLFADRDGHSDQVIYFELSGGTGRTAEEGLAFLRGGKGLKGDPKLVEFTLCFGDGRFERFSDKGTLVAPGE